MRRSLFTTTASALILSLGACSTINEADQRINAAGRLTEDQARRMAAAQRGEVIFEKTAYYGTAVRVPLGEVRGKPLPKKFEAGRGFSLVASDASIDDVKQAVYDQTGIPVNIRTTYQTPSGDGITIPIGAKLGLAYTGALSKGLDMVAARTDTRWTYDGSAITFDRMVTESYQVPLPTGETSFSSSVAGLGSVSGSSVSLSRSATLDPWAEIEKRLAQVVAPPAEVLLSKNAGTVTVFGPPSVQARAASVVDSFKAIYGARIGLEIGIFFVDSSKLSEFEAGIEAAGSNYSLSGLATALAGNGVATIGGGQGTVSFRNLAQNAAVIDFRQASSIAQSGVWTPTVIKNTTNYVSGTSTSVTDGVTSTSIETASVDAGLSIHALPRIVNGGNIQLSLTLLQSSLTGLESFTSSNSSVQLPKTEERALQNDAILSPGETLILSGFEQEYATRSTQTNLGLFGGASNAKVTKARMIVLVRPAILPVSDKK